MTKKRILEYAYTDILNKWYKEIEKIEKLKKEGKRNSIAEAWEAIYWRDLKEIEKEILKASSIEEWE